MKRLAIFLLAVAAPAAVITIRPDGVFLFDGKPVGTVPADAQGNFAGQLNIPVSTSPGSHVITVRGSACELNVTVNVAGAIAFTGSPDHTGTIVLGALLAIMVGMVLVLGARRRRGVLDARAGPPRA